jgi:hypothetical protein
MRVMLTLSVIHRDYILLQGKTAPDRPCVLRCLALLLLPYHGVLSAPSQDLRKPKEVNTRSGCVWANAVRLDPCSEMHLVFSESRYSAAGGRKELCRRERRMPIAGSMSIVRGSSYPKDDLTICVAPFNSKVSSIGPKRFCRISPGRYAAIRGSQFMAPVLPQQHKPAKRSALLRGSEVV